MEIPYEQLSLEALEGVIQNFILREGTDYGAREWTLPEKIQQILLQLQMGDAKIVYDSTSESCTIIKL